jgi:hypothetical protein
MNAPTTDVASEAIALLRKAINRCRFIGNESRRVYDAIVLLGCTTILIAVRLCTAGENDLYLFGIRLPVRCWLYETFGVKCALCGLSRSLCHIAHCDFRESLAFHALGPAIFGLLCLQIPYRISGLWARATKTHKVLCRVNAGAAVAIAIGIFVNWVSYIGGLIL